MTQIKPTNEDIAEALRQTGRPERIIDAALKIGAFTQAELNFARTIANFRVAEATIEAQAREVSEARSLEGTLAERGARYGDFTEHAKISEALLGVMMGDSLAGRFATSWGLMKPFQRQALRTICDKLARIANGDPDYIDNWHDIQGYSKLVEDRLTK